VKFNELYSELLEYVTGGSRSPKKYDKSEEAENAKKSALQATYSSGMKIAVSTHAGSQAKVRRSDLEPNDWRTYLKRATKALKGKPEGDYLIYSKQLEQGVVMAFYPNNKLLRLITVLPKGKGFAKAGTEKVMVESVEVELEVIEVK
tara:strand:- start:3118 stop:3558 length:441 start_codon:yes stop_codon:yes gene_type:complete